MTRFGRKALVRMLVLLWLASGYALDAKREYAYGPAAGLPASRIGTFSQALYDLAGKKGWTVISMKNDWNRIFAFDP